MTGAGLILLTPYLVISFTIVVLLLVIAFRRDHLLTAVLTLVGLAGGMAALLVTLPQPPATVTALLTIDGYARFFIGLVIATTFAVVLLAHDYLRRRAEPKEEFYVLLLLAALGSMVLVASNHFASFFLGLETLSIALYGLIGYTRLQEHAVEAGLKYLILAATSAAFLLFGMALVYAETGTMEFARLVQLHPTAGAVTGATTPVLLTGLGMIVVGFGFKLAVVPFHLWTPDVYEGSPAPSTAFVATVSKGAMFALLLRFFVPVDVRASPGLFVVFAAIAIASMIFGNLLALLQNNVKRILAYSSIAHLGYMLVAFLAGGAAAFTAVTFYLVAYFVTTLGAFGVVSVLSGDREADRLDDYRGLFWRRPWLAAAFTAMLLSLAGIPLTVGFVGKFYLVMAGAGVALWPEVIVLVLTSAVGLFYYLRIIVALFSAVPEGVPAPVTFPAPAGSLTLGVLTLILVWLGVYPTPIIEAIQAVASKLV